MIMPIPFFKHPRLQPSLAEAVRHEDATTASINGQLISTQFQDGSTKKLRLPLAVLKDLERSLGRKISPDDAKDILLSPSMLAEIDLKLGQATVPGQIEGSKIKLSEDQVRSILLANGVKEKWTKIDNLNIFYIEAGDASKETVLLIHGGVNSSSYRSWKYQMLELAENYHVVAMDLPGYGRSELKGHPDDILDFHIKFIRKFVDKINVDRVSVLSSSMGAWIAKGFLLENPSMVNKNAESAPGGFSDREINLGIREIAMFPGLVKLAIPVVLKHRKMLAKIMKLLSNDQEIPEKAYQFTEEFLSKDGISPAFMAFVHQQFSASPKEVISDLLKKRKTHKDVIRGYKTLYINSLEEINRAGIPYLIAHGSDDLIFKLDLVKATAEKLEHCTIKEFNCGHGPHLLAAREFNPVLMEFLAQDTSPELAEKRKKFKDMMRNVRSKFGHS